MRHAPSGSSATFIGKIIRYVGLTALLLLPARALLANEVCNGLAGNNGSDAQRAIRSADGRYLALIRDSARSAESSVVICRDQQALWAHAYRSRDGQHGWHVEKAAWTADSRFFVFSVSSSGGHQPWHFPLFAYAVEAKVLLALDRRIGANLEADFVLSQKNTLETEVQTATGGQRRIQVGLSELRKK